MTDDLTHPLEKIRLESDLNAARMRITQLTAFLHNLAQDLENADRDHVEYADDIHEAFGEGRPNGTKSPDDEEDDLDDDEETTEGEDNA